MRLRESEQRGVRTAGADEIEEGCRMLNVRVRERMVMSKVNEERCVRRREDRTG